MIVDLPPPQFLCTAAGLCLALTAASGSAGLELPPEITTINSTAKHTAFGIVIIFFNLKSFLFIAYLKQTKISHLILHTNRKYSTNKKIFGIIIPHTKIVSWDWLTDVHHSMVLHHQSSVTLTSSKTADSLFHHISWNFDILPTWGLFGIINMAWRLGKPSSLTNQGDLLLRSKISQIGF